MTMSSESLGAAATSVLSLRFGQITLGPLETLVLILALAAAFASGVHLWRIGRREDRRHQLHGLLIARQSTEPDKPERQHWYETLGAGIAASRVVGITEQQRLLDALAKAGIKRQGSLARFVAIKVCCAFALTALIWLFFHWQHWFSGSFLIRVLLLLGALIIGWRLPDIVLSRLAARRRRHLEEGLPDALDLLVISAEAGLSLDQAVEQVARTLQASNPVVADEFATTASEMRVLPTRTEALENLVQRTGLLTLRSITATLSQAIRFGTPLAELVADTRRRNADASAGTT